MRLDALLLGGLTFCCILGLAAQTVPAVSISSSATQEYSANSAADSVNAFAFGLYDQMAPSKGNLFFSPYSISTALTMTYSGASQETARQMANVLHLSYLGSDVHSSFAELTHQMSEYRRGCRLATANALWGQSGFKFLPSFVDNVAKHYRAGFSEVDYIDPQAREAARLRINGWVLDKTEGMVQNLIPQGVLTALTRLVLTNAVYFKGSWELPFSVKNTKPALFKISPDDAASVNMMTQTAKFRYLDDGVAQILEMPYSGASMSMVVILPKPGMSLDEFEREELTQEKTGERLAKLTNQKVEVFMPRFKCEAEANLNEALEKMGMPDAFDLIKADFSAMSATDELHIDDVIHKAVIDVNEEGTEAAAATAVVVGAKGFFIDSTPTFRADRPFFYLIRDLKTGCIVFMGRLVKP